MSDTKSEPIRILIVDDHPVVREGLEAILATKQEFDVIGEAGTGAEAVRLAAHLDPDVVLLDLEMPETDGVEALRQMRAADSELRAIVFTAYDTDDRILAAVRAGAQGYLLKGIPREELFEAIRVVHSGGSLLQPLVASKLLQNVSREQSQIEHEALTQRESEVLQLIARIAEQGNCSRACH